jgi:hypothetical protein
MNIDFRKRLIAATPLICVFAYLLTGYITGIWDKTLLIFLLIPIMPTLLGVKTIRITFTLIVFAVYIFIGVVFDLWHPGWLIFILVPIYYILFGKPGIGIAQKIRGKYVDKDMMDVDFDDK